MQGAESFVAPPSKGTGKRKKNLGPISYHSKVTAEKPQFFEKINFRGL